MEIRWRVVGCWRSSSSDVRLDNEFCREQLASADVLFVSGRSGAAAEAELKQE